MIRSIYVDGLRSLKKFNMKLKPGLNVLVGPNGSGKSNILTALELVYLLNKSDIGSLDAKVRSIDRKNLFDLQSIDKKLHMRIAGEIEIANSMVNWVGYSFEFELKYLPESDKMQFTKQVFEMKARELRNGESVQKYKCVYNNGKFKINKADEIFIDNADSIKYMEENYKCNKKNKYDALKYNSIISEMSKSVNLTDIIKRELTFDPVHIIFPDSIRLNIESSKPPVLSPIGYGLLSTLWKIKTNDLNSEQDEMKPNLKCEEIYDKIICYLKLISPELDDLIVDFDSVRNTYKADAVFKNGERFPLEHMSDGTLKWLHLITALLLSPNTFLLEEPENFLHPMLQQHFIMLMRGVLEFRSSVGVVSTHSETVLNSIDAKEMFITYYENGRTYANKVKNLSKLKKLLSDTGFQLGQYYALGTMDHDYQSGPA